MGEARYKGIVDAKFGTDATALTSFNNLVDDESGVQYIPQGDTAPKDVYGNSYAGPQNRRYRIAFSDRAQFNTLRTGVESKTKYFIEVTLDNGETHVTQEVVNFNELRPVDNEGQVQGRADYFILEFFMVKHKITETTA